jgi:hypothetical protein
MITIEEFKTIAGHKIELAKQKNNPSVKLNEKVLMWHTPQTPRKPFRYCIEHKGLTIPVTEIELHNFAKGRMVLD